MEKKNLLHRDHNDHHSEIEADPEMAAAEVVLEAAIGPEDLEITEAIEDSKAVVLEIGK